MKLLFLLQKGIDQIYDFFINPYEGALTDADEEFEFICWLYGRK